jgi:hypothetical protein
MRLIKMLGLATVVAVAAMAFIGAGSASAVLCKVKQNTCEPANRWATPTTILALTHVKAVLKGNVNVECNSHVTMVHEGLNGAGKLFGKVTKLTWYECTGCTTVVTETLPTFEDEPTTEGNGKATITGAVVKLSGCPFGVTCKASGTVTAEINGGTLGKTGAGVADIKFPGVTVTMSGLGCGTTATWTALYNIFEVNGLTTGSIFMEH